jgi:hypothetical protein
MQVLDLSKNCLTSLPSSLTVLTNLKSLTVNRLGEGGGRGGENPSTLEECPGGSSSNYTCHIKDSKNSWCRISQRSKCHIFLHLSSHSCYPAPMFLHSNRLDTLPRGLLASLKGLTRLELASNLLFKCSQVSGFDPMELIALNSVYSAGKDIQDDDDDDDDCLSTCTTPRNTLRRSLSRLSTSLRRMSTSQTRSQSPDLSSSKQQSLQRRTDLPVSEDRSDEKALGQAGACDETSPEMSSDKKEELKKVESSEEMPSDTAPKDPLSEEPYVLQPVASKNDAYQKTVVGAAGETITSAPQDVGAYKEKSGRSSGSSTLHSGTDNASTSLDKAVDKPTVSLAIPSMKSMMLALPSGSQSQVHIDPGTKADDGASSSQSEYVTRTPCEAAAAIATARPAITLLPLLHSLDLSNNHLLAIPPWVPCGLRSLNLAGNQLMSYPDWAARDLTQLKLLNLHSNRIINVSR